MNFSRNTLRALARKGFSVLRPAFGHETAFEVLDNGTSRILTVHQILALAGRA